MLNCQKVNLYIINNWIFGGLVATFSLYTMGSKIKSWREGREL